MGADQQFCLRWNNFHTNITSAFESLRDDEDFVDITLACEGRQIKAHKMVLSACSPYFRSLLRGNPCQHPIVFLKDVTFANLTSILDFMYHGEVNVSHNELATFLKTAEALRVRGLAEDEKKKEGDTCTESSSPPPPRDPPEPCSPGRPDDTGGGEGGSRVTIGDSRSSGGGEANSTTSGDPVGPPPTKRQRRRSGGTGAVAIISAVTGSTSSDHLHHQQQQHDHTGTMNTTSSSSSSHTNNDPMSQHQGDRSVRENVKNEPEDYINDDDDMLGGGGSSSQGGQQQHQQQQPPIAPEDIKLDGFSGEDGSGEYNLTDSVSITSRSQAAIQQQLQDTFSTFIPVAGQNPSFLQGHGNPGSSDHSRHPSFSLEGVQGLPPGISALPGTSMSQGGSSQDGPGQEVAHVQHQLHYPTSPPSQSILTANYHNSDHFSSMSNVTTHPAMSLAHGGSRYHLLDPSSAAASSASASTFQCPFCFKNYSTWNSLKKHKSVYHREQAWDAREYQRIMGAASKDRSSLLQ